MSAEVKQQGRSDQKRSDGQGRGRHNRKFRPGQEVKRKDPDAVPILKFGPSNNFMRFREALSKKALEEYRVMGKLILKGVIEEPKELNKVLYDLEPIIG
jgi:hypothetical protein